jgi:hypothetical protein
LAVMSPTTWYSSIGENSSAIWSVSWFMLSDNWGDTVTDTSVTTTAVATKVDKTDSIRRNRAEALASFFLCTRKKTFLSNMTISGFKIYAKIKPYTKGCNT